MNFLATDLFFRDYDVGPGTHPTLAENQQRAIIRTSQPDILWFINHCYAIWNWPPYTKAPGRKIESLVRNYIPTEAGTASQMLVWIGDNWKHYWKYVPTRKPRR